MWRRGIVDCHLFKIPRLGMKRWSESYRKQQKVTHSHVHKHSNPSTTTQYSHPNTSHLYPVVLSAAVTPSYVCPRERCDVQLPPSLGTGAVTSANANEWQSELLSDMWNTAAHDRQLLPVMSVFQEVTPLTVTVVTSSSSHSGLVWVSWGVPGCTRSG